MLMVILDGGILDDLTFILDRVQSIVHVAIGTATNLFNKQNPHNSDLGKAETRGAGGSETSAPGVFGRSC